MSLEVLAHWASILERQARESTWRLGLLEAHSTFVDRQLADVRRPAALRRIVAASLGSWSIWAAKLARESGVDISNAWRSLEQAAQLGLVAIVPTGTRSRGDGTLFAAPPWLRMAGLISVRPERSARAMVPLADAPRLDGPMAEFDAALLALDGLL